MCYCASTALWSAITVQKKETRPVFDPNGSFRSLVRHVLQHFESWYKGEVPTAVGQSRSSEAKRKTSTRNEYLAF
jgi:hypothetical protein